MMSILYVDTDSITTECVSEYLGIKGVDVHTATNGHMAVSKLQSTKVDAIVIEHDLVTHNSFELLYELRSYEDWQKIPVVLFTNNRVEEQVVNSQGWKQLNISAYLYKPKTSLNDLYKQLSKTKKMQKI